MEEWRLSEETTRMEDAAAREIKWANLSFVAGSGVFALFMLWPLIFDFNVFRIDDYLSESLFSGAHEVISANPLEERSRLIRSHVNNQSSLLMIVIIELFLSVVVIVFFENSFLSNPGRIGKNHSYNLVLFCLCYFFLISYVMNSWRWMCFYNVNCTETKRELENVIFFAVSFMLVASAPYLGRVLLRGVAFLGVANDQ